MCLRAHCGFHLLGLKKNPRKSASVLLRDKLLTKQSLQTHVGGGCFFLHNITTTVILSMAPVWSNKGVIYMMENTYDMLLPVLAEIESKLKRKITVDSLAKTASTSTTHLQRLFKKAFGRTIACYVSARKMTLAVEDLLTTNLKIIDIAHEYGFEHEQSFIRAFKRMFGITPGEFRSRGMAAVVIPPLQQTYKNQPSDGLFFGPNIIVCPEIKLVGRRHILPKIKPPDLVPKVAKDFWLNDQVHIDDKLYDAEYLGLTRVPPDNSDYTYYMPSVRVNKQPKKLADGLVYDTFPASLCAYFYYIGKHHYNDINQEVASGMYDAISAYATNDENAYKLKSDALYMERICANNYDGTYCKLEWIAPVARKEIIIAN